MFLATAAGRVAPVWILGAALVGWFVPSITHDGSHFWVVLLIGAVVGVVHGLASTRRRQRLVRFTRVSWAAARPRWRLTARWVASWSVVTIAILLLLVADRVPQAAIIALCSVAFGALRAFAPVAIAVARDLRWNERSPVPPALMAGGVLTEHVVHTTPGKLFALPRPERKLTSYWSIGTIDSIVVAAIKAAPGGGIRERQRVTVDVAGAGKAPVHFENVSRVNPEFDRPLPAAPGTITVFDDEGRVVAHLRFHAIP